VVGDVGYLSRGISHDEVYEWESYGDNINVVGCNSHIDARLCLAV
jgi:hypothetical protein